MGYKFYLRLATEDGIDFIFREKHTFFYLLIGWDLNPQSNVCNKSEKMGKSRGSIDCIGKMAASVLLKLFTNGYERC